MKKHKILIGFLGTLIVAILLRLFVFDVVSISNSKLVPDFYPGDFLLVSKIGEPQEGQWVFLKNYPQKKVYSVRKIVQLQSEEGWLIEEPVLSLDPSSEVPSNRVFVASSKLMGNVLMVLWSLPCKSSSQDGCGKSYRFMHFLK